MSVTSIWFMTLADSRISLFSFCMNNLTMDESGILKSPIISVGGSICDLSCNGVSFSELGAFGFCT